jgi:hypothetical protein
MKSNNVLVITALLMVALTTIVPAIFCSDIPSAIRIGMYALGFGTGVATGVLISRRQK